MMNYQIVPIEKLKPDPNQPRKHIDQGSIEELAVSVKNEGIVNAIEVDNKFVIITGERRWRAAKLAGLKEVPVKVLDNIAPKERYIRQVQENIHQNTMAPLDTAESLDKIRKWLSNTAAVIVRDSKHKGRFFQKGTKELHELLGLPESTISGYLDLLGVSPELRAALKVPGFQMSKIATIKEAPEKYRKEFGSVVATRMGMPRDTVRHIATGLRRAEKYGEDDNAGKLLDENLEGLSVVEAITRINKIVPDEMSRVKEPEDAYRFTSEKVVELMGLLDNHPLTSFDDFHRPLQVRKLIALGLYLQAYLKGEDLKNIKLKETKLLK